MFLAHFLLFTRLESSLDLHNLLAPNHDLALYRPAIELDKRLPTLTRATRSRKGTTVKVAHVLIAAVMGTVAILFARGLVRDIQQVFNSLSSGLK